MSFLSSASFAGFAGQRFKRGAGIGQRGHVDGLA
jgi:hypothetical protein